VLSVSTAVSEEDFADESVLSILIVDDHRSFADLLSAALNSVPGMVCVGTATSASEGVARAVEVKPDIVVMDIQMPGQDGLLATRQIREMVPDTVVAVVTAHSDADWVSRASKAGASAFIPKNGSLSEMIDVLRRARTGPILVAPSTFRGRPARPAHLPGPPPVAVPNLTPRELEVLTYLGGGMQVGAITRVLGISLHTCRGYVKSIHSKLGVSSQLEAVVKAQLLGLIGAAD
jgi:DNA-binding NarL/FixJ family response regulator